jgi:hypothetical protein
MMCMWNTNLLESVGENFELILWWKSSQQTNNSSFGEYTKNNGTLNRQETKNKRRVLTENLHDIGARIEHTPRKSLKRLAQETGVSMSSARTATQLLKSSMKFGVCCVVNCNKNYYTCVFNDTVNCEKYLRVERTSFSTPPLICEL